MNQSDIEEASLSRPSGSSVFGKCDDTIDQIRIDAGTKLALQGKASEAGMNLSEYVRLVLRSHIYGRERVASMEADRVLRALGNAG